MAAQTMAHYGVNIVLGRGDMSTIVYLPYCRWDDVESDDHPAIGAAVEMWRDEYGFDLSGIRWHDVSVELLGVFP